MTARDLGSGVAVAAALMLAACIWVLILWDVPRWLGASVAEAQVIFLGGTVLILGVFIALLTGDG